MLNAAAEELRTYRLDPFAQATDGYASCPAAKPPVLTEQEMRVQAHGRAERGTSCCLAGTCECGGAYRRDPEINDRVVAAIRGEKRFRDTSVWVTTVRKFVTLQGCVRSATQKKALERLVKRQPDVAIVWNETTVGVNPSGKKKP
jgi:osmotically-inducible protein OsmY